MHGFHGGGFGHPIGRFRRPRFGYGYGYGGFGLPFILGAATGAALTAPYYNNYYYQPYPYYY